MCLSAFWTLILSNWCFHFGINFLFSVQWNVRIYFCFILWYVALLSERENRVKWDSAGETSNSSQSERSVSLNSLKVGGTSYLNSLCLLFYSLCVCDLSHFDTNGLCVYSSSSYREPVGHWWLLICCGKCGQSYRIQQQQHHPMGKILYCTRAFLLNETLREVSTWVTAGH